MSFYLATTTIIYTESITLLIMQSIIFAYSGPPKQYPISPLPHQHPSDLARNWNDRSEDDRSHQYYHRSQEDRSGNYYGRSQDEKSSEDKEDVENEKAVKILQAMISKTLGRNCRLVVVLG